MGHACWLQPPHTLLGFHVHRADLVEQPRFWLRNGSFFTLAIWEHVIGLPPVVAE